MSMKILKDDTEKTIREILSLSKKDLYVGIPSSKTVRKKDQITNAFLGYLHEKGAPSRKIPPRPWLERGFLSAQPKIASILKKSLSEFFTAKNAIDIGFEKAGLAAQNGIKKYIKTSSNFTPLSEKTLKKRKKRGFIGEKPLIETGQLINSVSYYVDQK